VLVHEYDGATDMLTGELKNQIDRIRDAFWSGGISNPLEVIEQTRGEIAIRTEVMARHYRLNPRQAGALDHVLTHGKLTVGDLERTFPETNRRTLQRDLKAMLDKGVLREVGTGPTDPNRHYVLGDP
jgi:predicted HTH transcriptional regulator